MKKRIYQFTAIAAGAALISAAMHNNELQDFIYDSALQGGAVWAGATASVGDFARSPSLNR